MGLRRCNRKDVFQAASPDRTAFVAGQTRCLEERHHLTRVHVAVLAKVRKQTMFVPWLAKIDDQHATTRLQHTPDFGRALLPHVSRQVMEHHRFYAHFRDKDELLESGIHELLQATQAAPRARTSVEQVLMFSLPILEYVGRHRRASGPKMTRAGRIAMHHHLEHVLADLVADALMTRRRAPQSLTLLPLPLLARHIASTFVLVLNWWVESDSPLTPAQVNEQFTALIVPTLSLG